MRYTAEHIHNGSRLTVSAAEKEAMERTRVARNFRFTEVKEVEKPAKVEAKTTEKEGK